MLSELAEDNKTLAAKFRKAHELTSQFGDYPTTSLIENWLDETECRVWFLFDASREVKYLVING